MIRPFAKPFARTSAAVSVGRCAALVLVAAAVVGCGGSREGGTEPNKARQIVGEMSDNVDNPAAFAKLFAQGACAPRRPTPTVRPIPHLGEIGRGLGRHGHVDHRTQGMEDPERSSKTSSGPPSRKATSGGSRTLPCRSPAPSAPSGQHLRRPSAAPPSISGNLAAKTSASMAARTLRIADRVLPARSTQASPAEPPAFLAGGRGGRVDEGIKEPPTTGMIVAAVFFRGMVRGRRTICSSRAQWLFRQGFYQTWGGRPRPPAAMARRRLPPRRRAAGAVKHIPVSREWYDEDLDCRCLDRGAGRHDVLGLRPPRRAAPAPSTRSKASAAARSRRWPA